MPTRPSRARLSYLAYRLSLTWRWWPRRWRRLWGLPRESRTTADLPFALLDLLGLFDLYEALVNTLSPATRPLTTAERRLLYPVFGRSVPYELIRIDERAYLGPRQAKFCYVSFHTINSWGPMPPPVLVHEVVHVWQYTHRGAAYVPRALFAQTTAAGYDYGGLGPLARNAGLEDFNYEQQADIIEDFFRLANGYQAQWVRGRGPEVLPYYYPYAAELTAPPR